MSYYTLSSHSYGADMALLNSPKSLDVGSMTGIGSCCYQSTLHAMYMLMVCVSLYETEGTARFHVVKLLRIKIRLNASKACE